MINDNVHEVKKVCFECDGEGHVTVDVQGGYFDTAQQQWFPDTQEELCDNCYGSGFVYEEIDDHEVEEEALD